MLSLLMVGIIVNPVSAAFPDVPTDHIYADAINYVQSEGIVNGFEDGEYKPSNNITRFEFTKILINSSFSQSTMDSCLNDNNNGKTGGIFSDVMGEEGTVWGSYLCVAKFYNVVNGYRDGTFRGGENISFGEASKIIVNTYKYIEEGASDSNHIFGIYVDELAHRKAIATTIESIDDSIDRGEMAEIIYRLNNGIVDKKSKEYGDLIEGVSAYSVDSLRVEEIVGGSGRYDVYRNSDGRLVFSQSNPVNDPHTRSKVWIGKSSNGGQHIIVQNISYGGNDAWISTRFMMFEYDFKNEVLRSHYITWELDHLEILGEHDDPYYVNCTTRENNFFEIINSEECLNDPRTNEYLEQIEILEQVINYSSEGHIEVKV